MNTLSKSVRLYSWRIKTELSQGQSINKYQTLEALLLVHFLKPGKPENTYCVHHLKFSSWVLFFWLEEKNENTIRCPAHPSKIRIIWTNLNLQNCRYVLATIRLNSTLFFSQNLSFLLCLVYWYTIIFNRIDCESQNKKIDSRLLFSFVEIFENTIKW